MPLAERYRVKQRDTKRDKEADRIKEEYKVLIAGNWLRTTD